MKRKIISLLLALCLIVGMIPLTASAESAGDVAKIKETGETFTDLQSAIDAASIGQTVQLLQSVTPTDSISITEGITLDLCGYDITKSFRAVKLSGGTETDPIVITDSAATSHTSAGTIDGGTNQPVYISDGYVKIEKVNLKANWVASNGTCTGIYFDEWSGREVVLVIDGINIGITSAATAGSSQTYGVSAYTGSVTVNNTNPTSFPTEFNIKASAGTTAAVGLTTAAVTLNVNDGTFSIDGGESAGTYIAYSYNVAPISICGGNYTLTGASQKVTENGKAVVTGGTFNFIPTGLQNGYTYGVSGGKYIVSQIPVAQVGEATYTSLQEAVNAAAQGNEKKVTLLGNVTMETPLELYNGVTIEKGTNTLALNGSPAIIAPSEMNVESFGPFQACSDCEQGVAYYRTLQEAVDHGSSVRLTSDVTLSATINVLAKDLTLDLNGHTIDVENTVTKGNAFFVKGAINNSKINVLIRNSGNPKGGINGNIEIDSQNSQYTFTLEKSVTVTSDAPLSVFGNGKTNCITANIYGTLISTGSAAIQGNGSGDGGEGSKNGGTVINIYEGAKVDGGNMGVGIYHPQSGQLNIFGGEVTGATAVYLRSGTLHMEGGKISATGAKTDHASIPTGGVGATGDAVVVDSSNYPGGDPKVEIIGGSFISSYGDPVASYTTNDGKKLTGFIQGGSFSKAINEKLLDDSIKYEMKDTAHDKSAPYSYYSTIEEALKAADEKNVEICSIGASTAGSDNTVTVIFKDTNTGKDYTIKTVKDETITLPTPVRDGYFLVGWKDTNSSTIYKNTLKATQNITLVAQWSVITSSGGVSTYTPVITKTENGTVAVSSNSPKEGDTVTITTIPEGAYRVKTVVVVDANGKNVTVTSKDGKYTFTQPDSKVTITVTFVWNNPFTDVKESAWYYDAVKYVHEHHIMIGTSATTFEPNTLLTRAQAVQILYNLESQPTVTGNTTFTDVSGHWALDPISWAQKTGIVKGYEDNSFRPNRVVTREEFAEILYNYASYKGYDLTAQGDLSKFPDSGKIQDWAEAAMEWANGSKLINGHDDGTVDPQGNTTRAQTASILMRFDLNLVQ